VEIDRVSGAGRAATPPPAVRPPVGRTRPVAAPDAAAAATPRFDEAIDIHLGIDRQTGHLAIVGGDVRFEPRRASGALPEPTARRPASDDEAPPPPGSLVDVVV
jgi:hypothetical protein